MRRAQFSNSTGDKSKIKRLKQELGSELLIRTKRGLSLAPQGKILYEKSRKILNEYNNMFSQVKLASGVISGEIKISTIYSIGLYELNESVKHFIKKYPTVHLDVEFSQAPKIYEDLLREKIDIGLVARRFDVSRSLPMAHSAIDFIHGGCPYRFCLIAVAGNANRLIR